MSSLYDLVLLINQFLHLLKEIHLYLCQFIKFFKISTLADSFIHYELSLTCRIDEHIKKLIKTLLMEILHISKTVTALLE